jgi:hypothetical protein
VITGRPLLPAAVAVLVVSACRSRHIEGGVENAVAFCAARV